MKDLLASYSLSEIVIFIVFLMVAAKELVSTVDWFKARIKNVYDKDSSAKKEHEELKNEINDLSKFYDEKEKVDKTFESIDQTFKKINSQIDMLIESDKEDIKSFITVQHHYFVYNQCWIDDYSMECLEKRFAIYEKEHGNSFIEGFMNELRALPRHPPADSEHKYAGTAQYVKMAKK